MNKKEVLRRISEHIAMQECAIEEHPRKVAAVYEIFRNVIKAGQRTIWESKIGEIIPLNDHEKSQIQHFIASSSFISAWNHLAGNIEDRDKGANSCSVIISFLGPDTKEVFQQHFECEHLWRRTMKKEGVGPRRRDISIIILFVLIIGAILFAVFRN
ncbi:MAG: hypothetical protein IID17_08535 [Nitrospinae bacterium]|nr:hypothetical protein [Nitrospinota bacterium]